MRAAAVVCLVFAASVLMVCIARADDPEVSVFTDGPQSVTIIRGCHSMQCLNRAANVAENGRLKIRKASGHAKAYWVRTRVANGALVCEKFLPLPERLTADEIAERVAEMMKDPC